MATKVNSFADLQAAVAKWQRKSSETDGNRFGTAKSAWLNPPIPDECFPSSKKDDDGN